MEDREPVKNSDESFEILKQKMIQRVKDNPQLLEELKWRLQHDTIIDWDTNREFHS